MDDPFCDMVKLVRTYKQFGHVNRLFSRWNAVYASYIRPHLTDTSRVYSLLDVGSGFMDNSIYIRNLAKRDGFQISVTGLDPNPGISMNRHLIPTGDGIAFVSRYLHELPISCRYDFVISNHLLHHLNEQQITELTDEIALRTNLCAIMNDIHRSRLAYSFFYCLMIPYMGWSFIRVDGLRSIKRSFLPSELKTVLNAKWRVKTVFPYRLLAIFDAN